MRQFSAWRLTWMDIVSIVAVALLVSRFDSMTLGWFATNKKVCVECGRSRIGFYAVGGWPCIVHSTAIVDGWLQSISLLLAKTVDYIYVHFWTCCWCTVMVIPPPHFEFRHFLDLLLSSSVVCWWWIFANNIICWILFVMSISSRALFVCLPPIVFVCPCSESNVFLLCYRTCLWVNGCLGRTLSPFRLRRRVLVVADKNARPQSYQFAVFFFLSTMLQFPLHFPLRHCLVPLHLNSDPVVDSGRACKLIVWFFFRSLVQCFFQLGNRRGGGDSRVSGVFVICL